MPGPEVPAHGLAGRGDGYMLVNLMNKFKRSPLDVSKMSLVRLATTDIFMNRY